MKYIPLELLNYQSAKVTKEMKCILELDNGLQLIFAFLHIPIDFLFGYLKLLRRKLKIKEEEHFWIEKSKKWKVQLTNKHSFLVKEWVTWRWLEKIWKLFLRNFIGMESIMSDESKSKPIPKP